MIEAEISTNKHSIRRESVAVYTMGEEKKKNVCVVVLGDIGRSPRMQYHAQSLIREGFNVDIIGYADSPLLDDLEEVATVIGVKKPFPFDECKYNDRCVINVYSFLLVSMCLTRTLCKKKKNHYLLSRSWQKFHRMIIKIRVYTKRLIN